jgi:hypothetical protein
MVPGQLPYAVSAVQNLAVRFREGVGSSSVQPIHLVFVVHSREEEMVGGSGASPTVRRLGESLVFHHIDWTDGDGVVSTLRSYGLERTERRGAGFLEVG